MTKENLGGLESLGKNFTETTPDNRYFRSADGQWRITLETPGGFTIVTVEHFGGCMSGRGPSLNEALEDLLDNCNRKIADCHHVILSVQIAFDIIPKGIIGVKGDPGLTLESEVES